MKKLGILIITLILLPIITDAQEFKYTEALENRTNLYDDYLGELDGKHYVLIKSSKTRISQDYDRKLRIVVYDGKTMRKVHDHHFKELQFIGRGFGTGTRRFKEVIDVVIFNNSIYALFIDNEEENISLWNIDPKSFKLNKEAVIGKGVEINSQTGSFKTTGHSMEISPDGSKMALIVRAIVDENPNNITKERKLATRYSVYEANGDRIEPMGTHNEQIAYQGFRNTFNARVTNDGTIYEYIMETSVGDNGLEKQMSYYRTAPITAQKPREVEKQKLASPAEGSYSLYNKFFAFEEESNRFFYLRILGKEKEEPNFLLYEFQEGKLLKEHNIKFNAKQLAILDDFRPKKVKKAIKKIEKKGKYPKFKDLVFSGIDVSGDYIVLSSIHREYGIKMDQSNRIQEEYYKHTGSQISLINLTEDKVEWVFASSSNARDYRFSLMSYCGINTVVADGKVWYMENELHTLKTNRVLQNFNGHFLSDQIGLVGINIETGDAELFRGDPSEHMDLKRTDALPGVLTKTDDGLLIPIVDGLKYLNMAYVFYNF